MATTPRVDTKGRTCYQIFQEISKRQITALMFHEEMADYFDFLGLHGFKRLHEYQHLTETVEHRAIKRYYINHHNMLLAEKDGDYKVAVIPADWYKYQRTEVTPQIRRQAVEKAFTMYADWETETKECYEDYAKSFIQMGAIADFDKINELVKDVDMELKYLHRMMLELKAIAFDEIYIASMQHELHEKYDKKTQEIGVHIC